MKKRFLSLLLVFSILATLTVVLPATASAEASGNFGTNLTWTLDDGGTLTISGTGKMPLGANNPPWYDNRSNIKKVIIKNGVTSISKWAFYDCDNLTSVIIPNSIKYIDDWAFACCYSLTNVTIPNSVTSIGECAFAECKGLTSITIPSSVTSIGEYAFMCCFSLANIKIPNNVTSIKKAAFARCESLTSITIPSSVTSIGEFAFGNCKKLVTITVSQNNVEYSSDSYGVLYNKNKTSLVQYPAGSKKNEFVIPNSVTSIGEGAFSHCQNLKKLSIPYSVKTIDSGAFGYGDSSLTDIYYTGSKMDWEKISISDSNEHLTNVRIHYNSSGSKYEIVYNGNTYDLLSQPINIDKESNAKVKIKVNYKNGTGNEKIYISQNSAKYVELENNISKTIEPANIFDVDKDIYILVVNTETADSHAERTKLKIVDKRADGEFLSNGDIDGLNFKLGGKEKGFTIPSDIAVFGGTEIKWDFGCIPISVEYDREDDNKINVVFGAKLIHSDGKEDKFFEDFKFKEYKDSIKKLTADGRTLKQLRNDFKMSNAYKMNLFGDKVIGGGTGKPSFDFVVAGYGELKLIDGKLKIIEGQLCLEAEVSYTYEGQLFIWTVPVYYKIGTGVGVGLEGDVINIAPETFIPELKAYITAKVKAEIGGGLGIAKVATVGASGEGSLNMKNALHEEYFKVWGEGEANFDVKVLGKEVAKENFAKGDFLIYETGNANGLIKDSDIVGIGDESGSGGGGGSLLSTDATLYSTFNNISRSSTYENESRAYASSSTEWYGDMPPVSLFDAEYTSKHLRLLAENVYTESAPIMCDIGGQKVMVMLWDDSERDAINRTMLVYSVYDDSNGVWSVPLPVCDDGTADFYPSFNDGYLVWQNEKSLLDDSMSLGDIAKLGEICVPKWNGNGFDTPVVLTNNDTLDTQPVVCASESEVSIIWTTNSENDILGLSGDNWIVKSSLIDSTWSEPTVVKKGLNTITNLSAGYTTDGLNIAYVRDDDNDLQTIDDRDIRIISDRGEYKLTDNDVLDSNPQIKGDKIYYYSGGNIQYRVLGSEEINTVFANAKEGLTDNFSVSESSNGDAVILWSKSTDGATEIFSTMLNDGKWSDEIQISETGNQSKYPTAVLEDDGSIYIAYNNGILTDGEITQTDLYVIDLTPSYDLSVSDAYIDEDTMTVFATVKNSGELNVDSYIVSLIDNGDINSKITVDGGLKAGESAEIEIKYIKPSDLTKHTIKLSVEMENDEYNTDNNSAELIVGNCDVEITDIQNHEILPNSVAVAIISNSGYSDTGNVNVYLRKNKADGEIVDTKTISNISAGKNSEVTFNYNIIENDNIQWYITAETENDEISLGNNDSYFINNCLYDLPDYSQEILRYDTTDGKLVVNGYAENNTADDLSGVSVLAVYNSTGTLKALTHSDTYVYKYDSTSVNLTVDEYTYETGDYFKLFLWKDLISIVPVCDAKSSTVLKE